MTKKPRAVRAITDHQAAALLASVDRQIQLFRHLTTLVVGVEAMTIVLVVVVHLQVPNPPGLAGVTTVALGAFAVGALGTFNVLLQRQHLSKQRRQLLDVLASNGPAPSP